MADFVIAYKHTSVIEGGYANNPKDTGGETWKGIARNKNPHWSGWKIVDTLKKQPGFPKNLSGSVELDKLVLSFFKIQYWDIMNLDTLQDQRVANELYDTGVNAGPALASTFFQRALNVCNKNGALFPDLLVDGNIGPVTVKAFNSLSISDRAVVWKLLNCLQGAKYIAIAEANKSQEIFIRSWVSRVFELK